MKGTSQDYLPGWASAEPQIEDPKPIEISRGVFRARLALPSAVPWNRRNDFNNLVPDSIHH